VDERLLLKLLQFFGWVYNDDDVTVNQDSGNLGIETHRYGLLLGRYFYTGFVESPFGKS
jgi:hypothetical protein